MLARHFETKSDSFVLPPLELSPDRDGNIAVIVDGAVLSMNFEKHLLREQKKYGKFDGDPKYQEYLDTSEVEREHGAEE